MAKIDQVLFPTDFSETADRALPWAVYLADGFEADLHLLHAVVLHADDPADPSHVFPSVEELYDRLGSRAEEHMRSRAREHAPERLSVHRVQRRGISPAPVVLDYAQEHDVDLVVMGTHGRRGLRHMLLGSVAEEVIRRAHCSVMTVPPGARGPTADGLDTILVPTDFSEHADRALEQAVDLARVTGAQLLLYHVVEEMLFPDTYSAVAPPEAAEKGEAPLQRAREALERRISELGEPGLEASVEVEWGHAGTRIGDFAEDRDVDLIVIATHGLTGLRRVLLGSVTEMVVRSAPCPVFTVRTMTPQGV